MKYLDSGNFALKVVYVVDGKTLENLRLKGEKMTVLNFKSNVERPEILFGMNKTRCGAACAICGENFIMDDGPSFYNGNGQPVCWCCAEMTDADLYNWFFSHG